MLRLAEEILLLLFVEEQGKVAPHFPPHSLHIVLAGAVLMDLALANRIDTDLEHLTLIDATPLEDDLLDPTLAEIAQTTGMHSPPPRLLGHTDCQTGRRNPVAGADPPR